MKKLTLIILLVLMGFFPIFCEKYTEVEKMMESFITHTNEYADAVLAAETGDQVAEIFLQYTRLIQEDQISLMSIATLYPELAAMEEPPAELLPLAKQMVELEGKMNQINKKIMSYISEPVMIEAFETISSEMESLKDMEDL